jgi:hypothetical protein
VPRGRCICRQRSMEIYRSMLNMDSKSFYQCAFIVNGLKAVTAQVWPESHGFYPVRAALQSNPLVCERLAVLDPVLLYARCMAQSCYSTAIHRPPWATKGYTPTFQRGLHCWDMGLAGVVGIDGPPIEWIVMPGCYRAAVAQHVQNSTIILIRIWLLILQSTWSIYV